MLATRVIPCLLYMDGSLVKTVHFKNPAYVGDAINAIKIYNEKEVDELIFLDITATAENRAPDLEIPKRRNPSARNASSRLSMSRRIFGEIRKSSATARRKAPKKVRLNLPKEWKTRARARFF